MKIELTRVTPEYDEYSMLCELAYILRCRFDPPNSPDRHAAKVAQVKEHMRPMVLSRPQVFPFRSMA